MIFLEPSYDPGPESLGPLVHGCDCASHGVISMIPLGDKWLHTGTLGDLLNSIENPSPVLDVLRPVVAAPSEVQEKAPIWAKNLSQLRTYTYVGSKPRLQQIFVQFVVQKLTHLSRKEIDRMLGLTPLEETVAGKELIELGEQKGLQKGVQKSIMQLLTARFGPVSPVVRARISAVSEMAALDQLFSDALTFTSIELFEKALPK